MMHFWYRNKKMEWKCEPNFYWLQMMKFGEQARSRQLKFSAFGMVNIDRTLIAAVRVYFFN
jgi:hypothetical protein